MLFFLDSLSLFDKSFFVSITKVVRASSSCVLLMLFYVSFRKVIVTIKYLDPLYKKVHTFFLKTYNEDDNETTCVYV